MSDGIKKTKVYIPPNAKTNLSNEDLDIPETEYEETRTSVGKEAFKEVAKGKYGSKFNRLTRFQSR